MATQIKPSGSGSFTAITKTPTGCTAKAAAAGILLQEV